MTLHQVIEALIFASPKPLSTAEIVAILREVGQNATEGVEKDFAEVNAEKVNEVLQEVAEGIRQGQRGFLLMEQANGWGLATHPDAAPWVRRLYPEAKPTRLSGPALETLAIIAYRQPVTRADMEAVRGVAVDGVMQVLLDRGLVRISGRAEVPGRPLLYCTTEYFLQHFGLKTTDELPNASELRRMALPTPPPPAEGDAAPAEGGKKRKKGAAEAGATEPTTPVPETAELAFAPEPAVDASTETPAEAPAEPEAATNETPPSTPAAPEA